MTFAELLKLIFTHIRPWVSVAPWECCVRVRAGKHVRNLRSGFHFLIPVVDRIYRFSSRLRTSNVYAQTLTTSDGKTVSLRAVVRWRISDLTLLLQGMASPEDVLIDQAAVAIAELVRQTPADSLATVTADVNVDGCDILGINLTDLVACKTFRLLNDQMTEHSWGGKVEVEQPLK